MEYIILNATTKIASEQEKKYGVIDIENNNDINLMLDMYSFASPIKELDSIDNRAFGLYTLILKHYNKIKSIDNDIMILIKLDWSFPPLTIEVTKLLRDKNILVCHLFNREYDNKIICHYICNI